jgi:hypothetical protein
MPTRRLAFNDIFSLQNRSGMMMAGTVNPNLLGLAVPGQQDSNQLQQLLLQNQAAFAALSNNNIQPDPLPTAGLVGGGGAANNQGGGGANQFANSSNNAQQQQAAMQSAQLAAWRQAMISQNNSLLQQQGFGMMSQNIMPNQGGLMGTGFAVPAQAMAPIGLNQGLQSLRADSMHTMAARTGADLSSSNMEPRALVPGGNSKWAGRHPVTLFMSCDDDSLSEYQCLVRKQIELFEARKEEVESNSKGRNKPIVLGQVGIRCRHCSMLSPKHRSRGAMYYPAKLNGLYQAAQSMASGHLCHHCQHTPHDIRQELLILRERKSSAGGGKKYWGDGVRVLGVFEDDDGLRFKK